MAAKDFSKRLESLSKIFQKKIVLSSQELQENLGHRMAIKRLVEVGWLTSITRSYYCLASANLNHCKIVLAARLYPEIIFDGDTALYLHGLHGHVPDKPQVYLEKGLKVSNQLIDVIKRSNKTAQGVESITFNGAKIRVFSLERMICATASQDEDKGQQLLTLAQTRRDVSIDRLRKFDSIFNTQMAQAVMAKLTPSAETKSHPREVPLPKEVILSAALSSYSTHGPKGLSFKFIAEVTGISTHKIKSYYSDAQELRQAVFDARTRELASSVFELPERGNKSAPEYLREILEITLENIESESRDMFRFQCWALAEESYIVNQMVSDACLAVIRAIQHLILEHRPDLTALEAETRAAHLAAMTDHFRYMHNLYTNTMKFSVGKKAFMKKYRETFLDTYVEAAFQK